MTQSFSVCVEDTCTLKLNNSVGMQYAQIFIPRNDT